MLRLPPVSVLEKGSDLMVDRMHFDIETGRLVDERTMVRDGRSRKERLSPNPTACCRAKRAIPTSSTGSISGGWERRV